MFDQPKAKTKFKVSGGKRKKKLGSSHRGLLDLNSPPAGRRKTRAKKKKRDG